jgi:hypothetical protein
MRTSWNGSLGSSTALVIGASARSCTRPASGPNVHDRPRRIEPREEFVDLGLERDQGGDALCVLLLSGDLELESGGRGSRRYRHCSRYRDTVRLVELTG